MHIYLAPQLPAREGRDLRNFDSRSVQCSALQSSVFLTLSPSPKSLHCVRTDMLSCPASCEEHFYGPPTRPAASLPC